MFSSCAACLCRQERLLDDLKVEEGEEGEVDENGVTLSNKKVRPLKRLSLQMLLLFCVMMVPALAFIQKTNFQAKETSVLWPQTEIS